MLVKVSKKERRKEGREKESLSLSSKIELYVIVLTIVTTSSSQERIIRWSIFRRNEFVETLIRGFDIETND